jgi:hypothetical protein
MIYQTKISMQMNTIVIKDTTMGQASWLKVLHHWWTPNCAPVDVFLEKGHKFVQCLLASYMQHNAWKLSLFLDVDTGLIHFKDILHTTKHTKAIYDGESLVKLIV